MFNEVVTWAGAVFSAVVGTWKVLLPLIKWGKGVAGSLSAIQKATDSDAHRSILTLNAQLEALYSHRAGKLLKLDTHGHNLKASVEFQQMAQRASTNLSGRNWLKVVHPDDTSRLWEAIQQAITQGRDFDEQARVIFGHQMRWNGVAISESDPAFWLVFCDRIPTEDHDD